MVALVVFGVFWTKKGQPQGLPLHDCPFYKPKQRLFHLRLFADGLESGHHALGLRIDGLLVELALLFPHRHKWFELARAERIEQAREAGCFAALRRGDRGVDRGEDIIALSLELRRELAGCFAHENGQVVAERADGRFHVRRDFHAAGRGGQRDAGNEQKHREGFGKFHVFYVFECKIMLQW